MAIEEFGSGPSATKEKRPTGKHLQRISDVGGTLPDKLVGFEDTGGCCVNYTILPLLYAVLLYLRTPVRVIIG